MDNSALEPKFVGTTEAMRAIGCSRATLYRLIGSSRLERVKLGSKKSGGKTLISIRSIDALMRSLLDDKDAA